MNKQWQHAVWAMAVAMPLATAAVAAQQPLPAAPASAQASLTPEILVGRWARQGEAEVRFDFHADGTADYPVIESSRGQTSGTGHWQLKGDTLILGPVTTKILQNGKPLVAQQTFRRLAVFKDSLLTLTDVASIRRGEPESRSYERVSAKADAVKP